MAKKRRDKKEKPGFFTRLFKKEPEEVSVEKPAEVEKGKEEAEMYDYLLEVGLAKEAEVPKDEWVKTGIEGFDSLLEKGIPRGTSILVCGGPGTGKTIFCLQTLNYAATHGEKCLYMTFEESEERLRKHMHDFGWNPEELEKKGLLLIKRFDPFDITRLIRAMLEKAKGELLIEATPVLLPGKFKPDRIALDSLSVIAEAFVGREESYRIYIEQLFKFFEKLGATSFLITETQQVPTGIEMFLADGVIIVYNIRKGSIRQSAMEMFKLRGAKFEKKIVPMEIIGGKGIVVYPEAEVYGEEGMF